MGHVIGHDKPSHDILEEPYEHLATGRGERRALSRRGKARRIGGRPTLACQNTVGQHDSCAVSRRGITLSGTFGEISNGKPICVFS
jgi:hypothetical protein